MVTPRIWVSPRSNSAEPCTRGSTPTSAESGRMSVSPRPSMRSPSLTTRWRTSFLVSDRMAALISFSRPSNFSASRSCARTLTRSSSAARSCLPAIGQRLGELVGHRGGDRLEDVLAVVDEDRELRRGRRGDTGLDRRGGEDPLRLAQRGDERLSRLEALGHGLLVGSDRAGVLGVGQQLERLRGGLGLDHHDRDVAVVEHPAGHHHVERGLLELRVRRERDPLVLDQRNPDAADRAGERQARRAGWTWTRR